ncbi:hypothetical protein PIB19_01010 [Sphingomonas sp. 7/4-4]|uniref:hypothetical protein n=1 Tax=Sphingomonas sp. 7/4-4 TaxID=3018446 RepID=UPI0022F38B11|nr:hypothetical protein [Sphingomonas sp. 7/4-4]WBY08168.1 hypothetical protein PIB19_01010 [Sphingomonas sp. 7/4-4]
MEEADQLEDYLVEVGVEEISIKFTDGGVEIFTPRLNFDRIRELIDDFIKSDSSE